MTIFFPKGCKENPSITLANLTICPEVMLCQRFYSVGTKGIPLLFSLHLEERENRERRLSLQLQLKILAHNQWNLPEGVFH